MSYKLNQSDLEYTLLNGTYLVLGLLNLDKEVETIPMMYVWNKEKNVIYLHTSSKKNVVKYLQKNVKVSLNIVDAIKLDKDNFTLHYKSIIIHGKPKEIIDEITKRISMTLVCEKYIGEDYPIEHFQRTYKNTSEVFTIFEISIEEISGLGHETE